MRFAPAALLLASALGLFATGCGGGPTYVVAQPCYGYGCGYGYGYGSISTYSGTGVHANSGNGGLAVKAQLNQPVGLAVDSSGNLFVADSASSTVREVVASTGIITNASPGSGTANPMSQTALGTPAAVGPRFSQPSALASDPHGNLYVTDKLSGTVRRMSSAAGSPAIIAGSSIGAPGYSGDNGQATSARFDLPSGMAFDATGNLYIADTANNRIREVAAATGVVTTIAGDGTAGYSGDGGPAAHAQLSGPAALATDSKGNLYIADTGNSAIRKLDIRTGDLSTVAGTGVLGFSGDSASAKAAQLNRPEGITLDPQGNLFISDTGNQRIREVAATTGIISTIAGSQTQGYSGDGGPSSRAELNAPYATAIDASGNLYIADSGNAVIRKVLPNPTKPN